MAAAVIEMKFKQEFDRNAHLLANIALPLENLNSGETSLDNLARKTSSSISIDNYT